VCIKYIKDHAKDHTLAQVVSCWPCVVNTCIRFQASARMFSEWSDTGMGFFPSTWIIIHISFIPLVPHTHLFIIISTGMLYDWSCSILSLAPVLKDLLCCKSKGFSKYCANYVKNRRRINASYI